MAIEAKIKAKFSTVMALAGIMLLAEILTSPHVIMLILGLAGPGWTGAGQVILKYFWSAVVIVAVAFAAGWVFCIHYKLAWWAAALCVAAMFLIEVNKNLTNYTWYGLINGLLFMTPRLMLVHLAMLALVPVACIGAARAGMEAHGYFGRRRECPREL